MARRTWRRFRRPVRRFVVADRSMEPTLTAGQGLIGVAWGRARSGELRVLRHPTRTDDFWLVKRVERIDGDHMTVISDNEHAPTVDSRAFGPVLVAGSYRVIWSSQGSVTGGR